MRTLGSIVAAAVALGLVARGVEAQAPEEGLALKAKEGSLDFVKEVVFPADCGPAQQSVGKKEREPYRAPDRTDPEQDRPVLRFASSSATMVDPDGTPCTVIQSNRLLTETEVGGYPALKPLDALEPTCARVPEHGVIVVVANGFSSTSLDDGVSFTPCDPTVAFGLYDVNLPHNRVFDPQVIYDAKSKTLFWVMGFAQVDAVNAAIYLVSSHGDDVKAGPRWRLWKLNVSTACASPWWDRPRIAVNGSNLFISCMAYSTTASCREPVVARVSTADFTSATAPTSIALTYVRLGTTYPSCYLLEPAVDCGSTMYLTALVDPASGRVRVMAWEDAKKDPATYKVIVRRWEEDFTSVACNNSWLARPHGVPSSAWRVGDYLCLAWDAGIQRGRIQDYPQPHVRLALLEASTLDVVSNPVLFHDERAFAYASLQAGPNGTVGISVSYGGDKLRAPVCPSHAVGYLIPPSATTSQWTWRLVEAALGSAPAPGGGYWGDYFAIQQTGTSDRWCTTTFARKTVVTSVEPMFAVVDFEACDGAKPIPPPDELRQIEAQAVQRQYDQIMAWLRLPRGR